MKRMKVFCLGIIFIMIMIPTVFAGGGSQRSTGGTSSAADYVGPNKSYSGYPLPIVERPTEFTAMLQYDAVRPEMETTSVIGWIEQQTNIRLKPIMIYQPDQANVIFASRDFPDFYMRGADSIILDNAARDGDILALDDLLQRYSPTWWNFFNNNKTAKNEVSLDGKVYYLPYINWSPSDRNIRDQTFINKKWLDELGLSVPANTDEFVNVLRAFRDNAGKGSIPSDAAPFYYLFDNYANGTYFELFASYGVNITTSDYLSVENGRVVNNAVNPEVKEPFKFLQLLYREGLTPPECFTDDFDTYIRKRSSIPSVVGICTAANIISDDFIALAPIQTPSGKQPFVRRQARMANPAKAFAIFSDCKDAVAVTKFVELVAGDIEINMTVTRGMKDIWWHFRPDGKAESMSETLNMDYYVANYGSGGFWNSFIGLLDDNYYENIFYDIEYDFPNARGEAYERLYKHYPAPEGSAYFGAALNNNENTRMNSLGTDLTNYRQETFVRWITTNANIDAEWDAYVARMRALGADEWLALKQKSYDLMVK